MRTGKDTIFWFFVFSSYWTAPLNGFAKVSTTTRLLLSPPPYVVAAVEVLTAVELAAIVWSS